MTAKDRIQVLDQIMSHYFEYQLNIIQNYKNQLAIYLGIEAEGLVYQKTLLRPELIMHPLYEPIFDDGQDFINEVESIRFEQEYYLKKIANTKNRDIEDNYFFIEKFKELLAASEKLVEKNNWLSKKSQIHKFIFEEKMPRNVAQVKRITSILNSDFYNEIDALPIAENVSRQLDALEQVVPMYEKILSNHTTCKPLKELVKIILSTEHKELEGTHLFADEKSISDFLYLWNVKEISAVKNDTYKIAKTNSILYYINTGGWSDAVLVTEKENNIVVSDHIVAFSTDVVHPNYLLLVLNLLCYKEMAYYYYHRKNNPNAVLDFSIPIPEPEVQQYFAEALDQYFVIKKKSDKIKKIVVQAKNILNEQGEIAAQYFLDLKLEKK